MIMSAPASMMSRASCCWFLNGWAWYSVPQCGKTMTMSAPAARARLMSVVARVSDSCELPVSSAPAKYTRAIASYPRIATVTPFASSIAGLRAAARSLPAPEKASPRASRLAIVWRMPRSPASPMWLLAIDT